MSWGQGRPLAAATAGFFAALLLAIVLAAPRAHAADDDRLVFVTASGEHPFTVELVDTPAKRAIGLMYRTEMAADHGMLFDFKAERQVAFWMKNTYISLDMIFMTTDGAVVSIAADTVPESLEQIAPSQNARFVFEVIAGTARRIGLKEGDRARHPLMIK